MLTAKQKEAVKKALATKYNLSVQTLKAQRHRETPLLISTNTF